MALDFRKPPASFDGLPFYIDGAEIEAVRRVIVHDYPGSEFHDLEDLGRNAARFELNAYFASDTAEIDSAALVARLDRPASGLLVLPMFGALRARAVSWRPRWSKEQLNFVGLTISFFEERSGGFPIPAGLGVATLAAAGAGLAGVFAADIVDALIGADEAGFARADAARALADVAAAGDALRLSLALPSPVSATIQETLADASARLAFPATADIPAEVAVVFGAVDTLVAAQTNGGDAAKIVQGAAEQARVDFVSAASRWDVDVSGRRVALNFVALLDCEAARVLAVTPYTNRRDAAKARAGIAAIGAQIEGDYLTLGMFPPAAVEEMIGAAAAHLSRQIVDLAPVTIVETQRSLPANVLAYRLYGDPERGRELVERNHVATPAFMPLRFEAAAA